MFKVELDRTHDGWLCTISGEVKPVMSYNTGEPYRFHVTDGSRFWLVAFIRAYRLFRKEAARLRTSMPV